MDRRGVFFLVAAAACAALIPAADEKLRYVPTWLSCGYVVLALLSFVDAAVRQRQRRP